MRPDEAVPLGAGGRALRNGLPVLLDPKMRSVVIARISVLRGSCTNPFPRGRAERRRFPRPRCKTRSGMRFERSPFGERREVHIISPPQRRCGKAKGQTAGQTTDNTAGSSVWAVGAMKQMATPLEWTEDARSKNYCLRSRSGVCQPTRDHHPRRGTRRTRTQTDDRHKPNRQDPHGAKTPHRLAVPIQGIIRRQA